MKKFFFLSCSVVMFIGCTGLKGEFNSSQKEFYGMVERPFTEKDRIKVEKKFVNLKNKVEKSDYSDKKKADLEKNIDYYLFILEDLKD